MAHSLLTRLSLSTSTCSFLSFTVYFLHNELCPELDNPIVMESLCYSANKESEDAYDSFTSLTSYEPNLLTFGELNDSSVPFSFMIPSSDQDMDDVTLGKLLTEAHRGQADYCEPEGKSVSQSWSSVVFDGSEKPDERDSSNAQIRTLLEEQRLTIIAEFCERVCHHELQAAHAEEERPLLQGQLWRQKLEFREAHQQSLTEMKELRKFQSSTFDTIARRKLIENQNTALELSSRVQELQNDVNCMNDSQDFQDAESVRSGNSHVTSRPVSFPPHPIPEGMLRHSFVSPRRKEGPPSIWDTHGFSGNFFCKSTCIFISTASTRIESMEFVNRGAASYIYSGEK